MQRVTFSAIHSLNFTSLPTRLSFASSRLPPILPKPRPLATVAKMTDPSKYKLNHSMLRVKDPKRSVAFYEHLGMTMIKKMEMSEMKFDVYFMAYDAASSVSKDAHWTDREGVIELTHNYGTEDDPNYKTHNGNKEPQGFGHVCISVDNIQAACKRIEDAGYRFQKKLTDGRMRHIAFVLDPDGKLLAAVLRWECLLGPDYWVEVVGMKSLEEAEKETTTDLSTYRMV
jgi:lactoylglutathione lyase